MISSNTSSQHRTRVLDGPCDTSQVSERLQGTCPVVTDPPPGSWGDSFSDGPYLHPWVQNILRQQDPPRQLASASLRLSQRLRCKPQALELSSAWNSRPLVDIPLWRRKKGKAVSCHKCLLHSHFLSYLTLGCVTNKQKPPKCPGYQRDLQDILFLRVLIPTDIYQFRN